MIIINEAIELAQEFVASHGELQPSITYGLGAMQICQNEYYFDVTIIFAEGIPYQQFGGAPGISVDKQTGFVKTINWVEMSALKRYKELPKI